MTKAINLITVSFTASEAAANLAGAARAAIDGKAQIDAGKNKGAAALAVMIAGFSDDDAAMHEWSFDIVGSDNTVHTHVACMGLQEYGNTDLAWCRNGEGKVSKAAQSAYKNAMQKTFFHLPTGVAAVWTMVSKAAPIARAIRAEGMTASIEAGALKLEGGDTERAKAMREAKTLSALAKACEGATGSNREAPQNGGEGDGGEAAPLSLSEVLKAACALLRPVAAGNDALSPKVEGDLRALVALANKALAVAA
jgi:hypothetical protein